MSEHDVLLDDVTARFDATTLDDVATCFDARAAAGSEPSLAGLAGR